MARRRRLPRAAYPTAVERRYEAALGALVTRAWGRGTEKLVKAFERAMEVRADAREERLDARTIPGPLSEVLGGITMEFGRLLDREGELIPVGVDEATARANGQAVMGQLGAVIAVDPIAAEPWLGPVMEAWRESNVALIGGLGPYHAGEVERIVGEAWTTGKRAEWIQRELENRIGITRRRAELIARDQVGKLNGQLTMLRQSAYGVETYIWRTSLDERVRQMHADREGERFEWSTPPEDGHPGMPIQCRCVAEPDIQDQLDELERLGEEELEYGQPDEDLLSTAIDELAAWQPDEGLVRRLKEEANAGLALTLPRGGAVGGPVPRPVRAARQPVRTARTAQGSAPTLQQATEDKVKRAQAEETRRQQAKRDETKARKRKELEDAKEAKLAAGGLRFSRRTGTKGPLSDIPTGSVTTPAAIRGARSSANPPIGRPIHRVPPVDIVLTRTQTIGDIDALTAEGFEELKSAAGLESLSDEEFDQWTEKLMVQIDNMILAIDDFNPSGDSLAFKDPGAREGMVLPSAAQVQATPRRYTVLLRSGPPALLERINVALDKVRAYNPRWEIVVATEEE